MPRSARIRSARPHWSIASRATCWAIRRSSALALAKSKIALATFSRGQEFEADGIGVGISSRAGFDPYGATRFLTAMGRNAELRASVKADPRTQEFLSSHPATPERVANATLNARQYSQGGAAGRERAA